MPVKMTLESKLAFSLPWARQVLGMVVFAGVSVLTWKALNSRISRYPSSGKRKPTHVSSLSDVSDAAETEFIFDATKNQEFVTQKLNAKEVKISRILSNRLMPYREQSCRGTSVSRANFTPSGLENDRQWCIVDASSHLIITARAFPKVGMIQDETDSCGGRLEVAFPAESGCETFYVPLKPTINVLKTWNIIDDCSVHSFTDIDGYITEPHPASPDKDSALCSATLSHFFGKQVHLMYKGPRFRPSPPTWSFPELDVHVNYQDAYPLLVVSEESFRSVKNMVSKWSEEQDKDELKNLDTDSLVLERYRPNIVFEGASVPFAEDMWKEITITSTSTAEATSFTLVAKCTRCMLPNIDPASGVRNMSVPSKPLLKFRTGLDPGRLEDACFGCNAVPVKEGVLSVGDVVSVQTWGYV
ncbi:hypothetical protein EW146_g2558 [Bondarzewia mesenterica]|uniref:MOSC domain-containing protein n=1 Tax=Bondarzewia mesenterica TaxID=1095465 RepID=A0A4S4M0R5_9AGAM|nr:hypothetical protein EW146_g2558 [Bondarzewia mesenterica]